MKNFLTRLVVITAVVFGVSCDDFKNRVCGSDITLDCVRSFISDNAECEVIDTPIEKPYITDKLPIYVTNINTTVVTQDVYPSGLEGQIEEFYIHKQSGNLIMTVNYEGLMCNAPNSIIAVSQTGEEPVVFTEDITATYPTTMTAIMSLPITARSLKNAHIFADFDSRNPEFDIGPAFSQSSDPVISAAFAALVEDVPTALKQIFRTKASYFFYIYLQTLICDFGVPPNLQSEIDTTALNNILESSGDESIVEPCGGRDDIRECVAEYFLNQGQCSDVGTPDDEPVFRRFLDTFAPSLDITVTLFDAMLSGLDGNIQEFYRNEATNNLVLTVNFPNLAMETDKAPIIINVKGDQPNVVLDSNNDIYHVTLNAVIPLNNGLTRAAIENAFVTTTVNAETSFGTGQEYYEETDAQVAAVLQGRDAAPNRITKELFVTEGPSSFRAFVQKYICNFAGLSLTV